MEEVEEEPSEALAEEQNEEAIDFFADPGTSGTGPWVGRRQAESMLGAQEALVRAAAAAGRGEEEPLPWLPDALLPAGELPPDDIRITAKRLLLSQRRRTATLTRKQVRSAGLGWGVVMGVRAGMICGWLWHLGACTGSASACVTGVAETGDVAEEHGDTAQLRAVWLAAHFVAARGVAAEEPGGSAARGGGRRGELRRQRARQGDVSLR